MNFQEEEVCTNTSMWICSQRASLPPGLRNTAIIDKYAAQGWRYVGYLPTKISMGGVLCNIDLIFERKAEERD